MDLEKIVDLAFEALSKSKDTINTSEITNLFFDMLKEKSDSEFVEILIVSGYIPDLYPPDSSCETLYTKLCEALEVEWANRMGFTANTVTQKASYEDVVINIDGNIVVSDTKTFRLSRSQVAPNVKDFVKPEDYKKWISRHKGKKLGGLIVYPQLHEWLRNSDAYTYCSDKNNPIVMLPFHYLAYLLSIKKNYNTNDLKHLWDYKNIFPIKVSTRLEYWKIINQAILAITNDNVENFRSFLVSCESKLFSFVTDKKKVIDNHKTKIINKIHKEVDLYSKEELRDCLVNYRIRNETHLFDVLSSRIVDFRLTGDEATNYLNFIDEGFE